MREEKGAGGVKEVSGGEGGNVLRNVREKSGRGVKEGWKEDGKERGEGDGKVREEKGVVKEGGGDGKERWGEGW